MPQFGEDLGQCILQRHTEEIQIEPKTLTNKSVFFTYGWSLTCLSRKGNVSQFISLLCHPQSFFMGQLTYYLLYSLIPVLNKITFSTQWRKNQNSNNILLEICLNNKC